MASLESVAAYAGESTIIFKTYPRTWFSATIETDRLLMQPVTSEEYDAYSALFSDPDVMEKVAFGETRTPKQTAEKIEAWARQHDLCGALSIYKKSKKKREFIGCVSLEHHAKTEELRIFLYLRKNYWNQKFGKEVASAIKDYIPEMVKIGGKPIKTIVAIARTDNVAARKILNSSGIEQWRAEIKDGMCFDHYSGALVDLQKRQGGKPAAIKFQTNSQITLSVAINAEAVSMRFVTEAHYDQCAPLYQSLPGDPAEKERQLRQKINRWATQPEKNDPFGAALLVLTKRAPSSVLGLIVLGHGKKKGEALLSFIFTREAWKGGAKGFSQEALTVVLRDYAPVVVDAGYTLSDKSVLKTIIIAENADHKVSLEMLERMQLKPLGKKTVHGVDKQYYSVDLDKFTKKTAGRR